LEIFHFSYTFLTFLSSASWLARRPDSYRDSEGGAANICQKTEYAVILKVLGIIEPAANP
jgi:hypothetical protein